MEKELFKPTMRLNIQASVPCTTEAEGTQTYEEIKRFLQSYHTAIVLNGQVVMMLEPCCKDKEKKP